MYINFWYPVCTSDELDEVNPQRIELLGSRLVAFRAESGTAHLLADTCIHRGGSLSRGTTKGECIKCPYHGWEFSGDGKCQHIPSIPDTKPPARAKVDSYPIQEKYGIVFAFLGDLPEEERPPLWEISEWGQDGWRAGKPAVREINCYYERSVENGLDPFSLFVSGASSAELDGHLNVLLHVKSLEQVMALEDVSNTTANSRQNLL